MADFYYNDLKKFYGDRMNLIYTDTDSLVVRLETQDPEKDFDNPELKWRFGSIPGKMKVEAKLDYIKAYGPKHYLVKPPISEKKKHLPEELKLKGIPVDKAEYKVKVDKKTGQAKDTYTFYSIRSVEHEVYKVKMVKTVKFEDDKRIRLSDGRIVAIGYKGMVQ
jgi:hypothetical protein